MLLEYDNQRNKKRSQQRKYPESDDRLEYAEMRRKMVDEIK